MKLVPFQKVFAILLKQYAAQPDWREPLLIHCLFLVDILLKSFLLHILLHICNPHCSTLACIVFPFLTIPKKHLLLMGRDSCFLFCLPPSHIPQNSHFFNGMGLPLLAAAVSPTIAAPMTSIMSWNPFPHVCNEIYWEGAPSCSETSLQWEIYTGKVELPGVFWVMAQLSSSHATLRMSGVLTQGLAYFYLQIAPITKFHPSLKSTLFWAKHSSFNLSDDWKFWSV